MVTCLCLCLCLYTDSSSSFTLLMICTQGLVELLVFVQHTTVLWGQDLNQNKAHHPLTTAPPWALISCCSLTQPPPCELLGFTCTFPATPRVSACERGNIYWVCQRDGDVGGGGVWDRKPSGASDRISPVAVVTTSEWNDKIHITCKVCVAGHHQYHPRPVHPSGLSVHPTTDHPVSTGL